MRISKTVIQLFFLIIFTAAAVHAQQTFIVMVNSGDVSCNATCAVIGVPALYNDPDAIVFATQINSNNSNPHPIGAYYMYLKRWAIYNLDGSPIVVGSRFKVEYYLKSDSNHFAYVVPNEGKACIDNPALNGNPKAIVTIFPTSSPKRGALYNKGNAKADYKAEDQKWCIVPSDNTTLQAETVFNISFTGGSVIPLTGTPTDLTPMSTVQPPASNSTASVSTGAVPLQGNLIVPTSTVVPQLAPLTVIARVEWDVPTFGNEVYVNPGECQLVTSAYINSAILATDTVIVTGQSTNAGQTTHIIQMPQPNYSTVVAKNDGKNLRWSATADNGSAQLSVCNNSLQKIINGVAQPTSNQSAIVFLTGRKVNILVLR
ncbi:MAG: hypothetical protein ABJB40_07740 [Acidobacteriota bacterium]